MSYATQDDIELRYPGALEQAGPRDASGNLDEDAIALALIYASEQVGAAAGQAGLTIANPAPDWVIGLVVDIALYRSTPSAIASDAAFRIVTNGTMRVIPEQAWRGRLSAIKVTVEKDQNAKINNTYQ